MLYTEDNLKCPKCNTIYVDPRSLPCGEVVCNKCINHLEANSFKFCCLQVHSIPDKGFPICNVVARNN
jgi:hypothetical protein